MEIIKILINNAKGVGIFVIISLISMPVLGLIWPRLESNGVLGLTVVFAIVIEIAMFALYFLGGRFFIKTAGVFFKDALSFLAVIVIVLTVLVVNPGPFLFFAYPHLFIVVAFGNQDAGIQISVITSAIMIIIGAVTKNRIKRPGSFKNVS